MEYKSESTHASLRHIGLFHKPLLTNNAVVERSSFRGARLHCSVAQHNWECWVWPRAYREYVVRRETFRPLAIDKQCVGIYGSWGGYPYKDLEKCFEYLQGLPNLDLENAVAAGGSYGGYMMLWLQGQELGRKVSH